MYEAADWSSTISTGTLVGDVVSVVDTIAVGTVVVGAFDVGCIVGASVKHNGSDVSSLYESKNAVENALHPHAALLPHPGKEGSNNDSVHSV